MARPLATSIPSLPSGAPSAPPSSPAAPDRVLEVEQERCPRRRTSEPKADAPGGRCSQQARESIERPDADSIRPAEATREAAADPEGGQLHPALHAEVAEKDLGVLVHREGADAQAPGNLFVTVFREEIARHGIPLLASSTSVPGPRHPNG